MTESSDTRPGSEATRRALIAAGFRLFGAQGFAATTTRRLAAEAGTNVASISYHFGSKAGLHEACIRRVIERVSTALGPVRDAGSLSPAEAQLRLEGLLRALAGFIVASAEAQEMVSFFIREMNDSAASAETIYEAFIGPRHKALCGLWGRATGRDPESEEVRLAVFAMVGELVYFRVAQPFVLRRMGWSSVGPAEAARITDTIVGHLRAALERSRS